MKKRKPSCFHIHGEFPLIQFPLLQRQAWFSTTLTIKCTTAIAQRMDKLKPTNPQEAVPYPTQMMPIIDQPPHHSKTSIATRLISKLAHSFTLPRRQTNSSDG